MTAASVFAALHHGSEPFVLPNAWDVASAVLLADAGSRPSGRRASVSRRPPASRTARGADGA